MAETTNVALKKIAGSENWRNIFDHYNNSMDIADDEISTIQNSIAILANGNTHIEITVGQYVYIRNHDTLASGLYKAKEGVSANKVLSSSNMQAVTGGINDLATSVSTQQTTISSQADSISGLADGLAVVANGDTHTAVTSGQYVYVRNHTTLSEGLYRATAPIGTTDSLTTSNLTAVSGGGLNELKSSVNTLSGKIGNVGNTDLQSQVTTLNSKTTLQIADNTNLNNVLTQGIYRSPMTVSGVSTLSNCPVDAPFTMIVTGDGDIGGCVQTISKDNDLLTRRGTSGGFGNWTSFALNSNLESYESFSLALPSGWEVSGFTAKKYLNIVFLQGLLVYGDGTTAKSIDLGDCIPSTYASLNRCDFIAFDNSTDETIHGIISRTSMKLYRTATTSIKTITFNACYLT